MTTVRLRDATLADAELLEAWSRSPELRGTFNDFGMPPIDGRELREALALGPLQNERNGEMLVELVPEGTPIGTIGWHEVRYGPSDESKAWNIGIALLPEFRGKGYGATAQRLLADHLFATTDANRVEAQTDVDNLPEQRALEKAGFVREGTARGAQFRAGAYHDLITFARLRADA
jgi:RimJ/RimL family protein N-acetyltransferase